MYTRRENLGFDERKGMGWVTPKIAALNHAGQYNYIFKGFQNS